MFTAKNIFVFLLSILSLCLLLIFFNFLGLNETLNLTISASIFGLFITWYFKGNEFCLILFAFFYASMLIISQSLDVIWMFMTSSAMYLLTIKVIPRLSNIDSKALFNQTRTD